jgi:outer membrane protein assembly factor BamB
MTTRPTDPVPNWASDPVGPPPAVRAVPSAAQRALGFVFQQFPPFDFVNWFWGVIGDWMLHLSTASSRFVTLHEATDALVVGDTAIVDEHDAATFPGQKLFTVALTDSVNHPAVSGTSLVYAEQAGSFNIVGVKRTDLTTQHPTAAYAKVTAGAAAQVVTDGKFVAIAVGNFVELFDHDLGGAPLWTFDHTAPVNDIAMDGTHVYLVGDAAAGPLHARALLLATGAVVWSYNHNGNLDTVATNGRQVFVSGDVSLHASGAHMRALDAADGFDFANEGGTGLSTSGMAWDLVDANRPTNPGGMQTDGRVLYTGNSGGANRIEARSQVDGSSIVFGALPGAVVPRLALDQDNVYTFEDLVGPRRIFAFDKLTMALLWKSETNDEINAVASDGAALFFVLTSVAAHQLEKAARGNRSGVWRRVDPADDYLPMRQLIVPGD